MVVFKCFRSSMDRTSKEIIRVVPTRRSKMVVAQIFAFVVQWIEHRFAVPTIQVRFLARAHNKKPLFGDFLFVSLALVSKPLTTKEVAQSLHYFVFPYVQTSRLYLPFQNILGNTVLLEYAPHFEPGPFEVQ